MVPVKNRAIFFPPKTDLVLGVEINFVMLIAKFQDWTVLKDADEDQINTLPGA